MKDQRDPVHSLTGRDNQKYITGCGLSIESKAFPKNVTGWTSEMTCIPCLARVYVIHEPLTPTEMERWMLDNVTFDENTVKFKFKTFAWRFWWNPGHVMVYVFHGEDSKVPFMSLPLNKTDRTREGAIERARQWINDRSFYNAEEVQEYQDKVDNRAKVRKEGSKTVITGMIAQPTTKIPEGYDGPLCKACGKHDEGDFMPHPDDITQSLCMTCLVGGKR